jgi:putative SOS response-associated peptidase YedK
MCGRYASTQSRDELIETFDIEAERADPPLPPDYNVAPTKVAPVVVARPPREDRGAEPVRQLRNMRWGLVPSFAKDASVGSRMINARAETVAEKPSFRRAFAARRGLVPASGFYEWLPTEELGRSGKPLKQPFYLHRKDDQPLALAGIYGFWLDESKPDDARDAWVVSYSIITTTATDDVGRVHDRMPMAVTEGNWQEWLDPRTGAGQAKELMAPPPASSLDIYAITKVVNDVKNNGPQLLDSLPAS